jgi:hypothetical protein
MDVSHPGRAELVAAIGAIVMLFGLIATPWYEVGEPKIAPVEIDREPLPTLLAQADEVQELPFGQGAGTVPETFGAWKEAGTLGTIANLIILAAGLGGLAIGIAAAFGVRLDTSGWLLVVLSVLAAVMVVLRMIFRPESVPIGTTEVPYEFEAGLKLGIFVTLVGALIQLVGAVMRLRRPGGTPAATAPPESAARSGI